MSDPQRDSRSRDALVLISLWLVGLLIDLAWVQQQALPPAWDQGDHLSRALGFWQVLQQLEPFNPDWWHTLWAQAPSYRGPLTYLVTAPLFSLLGASYGTAMLSNSLFQALLLGSLYGQARLMRRPKAGLWAAFLAVVAPALLNQRTDYLIDFSLTAVVTACWCLMSWRHLAAARRPWLSSSLAGAGLGAVLLTRPTGLLLLWLPLLWLLGRAMVGLRQGRWWLAAQAALAGWLAWLLAGGWISQNWLTIVSTINNARRWGVLYQEGLEPNTLEGWLYYPRLLPSMAGAWLVAVVLVGALLRCWRRWRWPWAEPLPPQLLWWLSFPAGALLLASLMSTKDFRFVLPLLPQLLLGLALLMAGAGRWLQAAVVALGISGLLACQFGLGPNLTAFPSHPPRRGAHWPVAEIVATIRRQSPLQLSTLAVLPDSEHLNAFNLEAEGRRQDFRVAARQTVAPVDALEDDLNGFDWFLLKGGDQGVMSDERQAALSRLVRQSPAFVAAGSWPLPDGSSAELYRRRLLSLEVSPAACPRSGQPSLEIWPASGTSRLRGQADQLTPGLLLLDGQDRAVGQGMVRTERGGCLEITERLSPGPGAPPASTARTVAILGSDNRLRPLQLTVKEVDPEPEASLMRNRHQQLLALGAQLRQGELDALFAQVGRINQHDPEQLYLANGERLLQARLRQDPTNLDLLYPLALAQALQRNATAAAQTLSRISRLDPTNPQAHLGLGFVQLYRFKPWAAQPALEHAAQRDPSNPTLRTLRAVAAAMRLDLIQAHSLLSR